MNKLQDTNEEDHCITIVEARKILGKKFQKLTDREILQLITELEQLSDIFISEQN